MFWNVIFWKTRKQNSITKSCTSAEYVALSDPVSKISKLLLKTPLGYKRIIYKWLVFQHKVTIQKNHNK